jgi:adenosylcobinamide-phosphate synthase
MALLFAVRDLNAHAQRVRKALEAGDLPQARTAVSMLVGRDVASLDSAGVSRAAIESLAESFVDSFFATWFWAAVLAILAHLCQLPAVLGALSGAVLHRMASTADSMIGHKDERYRHFGTCAARLDDVLNFLPARLSVLPLGLAAILLGRNFFGGFKAFLRDRLKHASPNSAHSEAFIAGALDLKLAGPVSYDGEIHEKPWLGHGSPNAEAKHIAQVQILVLLAAIVSAAGVIAVLWSLTYFTV